ncbi:MAG TPA: cupin domain-containing protein [Gemmatimonadales bacterium]|nr:cupin domain-containing protein [Gemmatimonadales bacterium]
MRFTMLIGLSLIALPSTALAQDDDARVQLIGREEVSQAFSRGKPLIEVGDYKIHASRREGPGLAEIHTRDTDIAYVLEGSATLVTGGKAIELKSTGPEELRGRAIEGGETRMVTAGDVVVIPNGVPHWFETVKAPFLYYVVKVRQASRPAAIGAMR